jgi:hypothetical protein
MADGGLEFHAGRAGLVVPGAFVDRIVEVRPTALPPIVPGWLRGAAFLDARLVLVVGLTPRGTAPLESRKGILLRTGSSQGENGWVLEAASIGRFIEVERLADGARKERNDKLPAWIARAKTTDARIVGWIDVPGMLAALGAPASRKEA